MSEIKKLFDECFGELASDLPSKVFIRKLQDIILSGRPKKVDDFTKSNKLNNYNDALDEYDNWIKQILK